MSQTDSATRPDSTGARSPARPSLLAADTSARADRDSETVSILSSLATLEGETASHSAASRHTRIALGLLALVAILAAGTWAAYTHSERDQPAGNRPDAIAISQHAAARPDVATAVAPVAAPTRIASVPFRPAIVEDMVPGVTEPPANPLLALAATKSGPTIDVPKTDSAAAILKGTDTTIAVAQADPAPRARSQPRSSGRRQVTAARPCKKCRGACGSAREYAAAAKPRRRCRTDCRAACPRRQPPCERAKSVKAAAQPKRTADSEDAPKAAASDPPDMPSPAQPAEPTTAERLLRCQSLNFFAGKLCRWRTCFGLDGKDEACSGPAS